MRGLSPQEVKELIEYIDKNNSWKNMGKAFQANRKVVKYYNMTTDTRIGDVWQVNFYGIMGNNGIDTVTFRTEKGYDLKAKIYEWLDEPSVD